MHHVPTSTRRSRPVAALLSLVITAALFHGVASLAEPQRGQLASAVAARQAPPVAGTQLARAAGSPWH